MAKTNTSNKKRSQWVEVWRRLKRNKMAVLGLIILIMYVWDISGLRDMSI